MVTQSIEVPTCLNDIPLHKYLQFMQIDEEASDTFKAKRMLHLFCGIDPRDFNNIKHQDVENLLFKVGNVLNSQPKFQRRFTLDGVEYGIIPNFDDMTFGEFVDLDTIKDYKKDLGLLMSILYRRVTEEKGERYLIEPYNGKFDFRDMPSGVALGALVFFWTIGKDCLSATQSYMKKAEKQTKITKGLVKNGDGTQQSLNSATETLKGLMTSLLQSSIPSYYGLPIRAMWQPYKNLK